MIKHKIEIVEIPLYSTKEIILLVIIESIVLVSIIGLIKFFNN